MSWKTWYQEHLCTAEEAVKKIKSGDRVVVAHACGEWPGVWISCKRSPNNSPSFKMRSGSQPSRTFWGGGLYAG